MRFFWLLCLAILAAAHSFPKEKQAEDVSITYSVLEVYPRSRRVLITCYAPQAPRPITYTLLASRGVQVTTKVMNNDNPASFNINVTLKSSPDLLTYSCRASSAQGIYGLSAKLQLYWELWAKPVSQLQVDLALLEGDEGPTVELSCLASSGSPPITYSLVGKDGRVYAQERPLHGQPAFFFIPLSQMSGWFRCQAENSVSAQSSTPTLLVPGELPPGATSVLAGSLVSIAAIGSGMLGWTRL
uniref:protein IL-40 n=1 Tax=Jaculus jaculus TaxID=51337 RepID=UPI001E1B213D|nr:protein IL-40 [Jaculus jaculus]